MRRCLHVALLLGLIGAVVPDRTALSQTVKFLDHCTGAASNESVDVQVQHTTDTGASPFWAEAIDSAGTTSLIVVSATDLCNPGSAVTSGRSLYVVTPNTALGSADYDVSVLIRANITGQTDDDLFCVVARYTDTTHFYLFCITANTSQQWQFIAVNGTQSGNTPISSGAITVAANDVLKIMVRGDTIRLKQNASELLCVVNATLSGTGQGGVAFGNFGATATADVNSWTIDDITVTDQTGQGGDDNCGATAAAHRAVLLGAGN